jgi:G6PDH family F420-dependent oxidoreductase
VGERHERLSEAIDIIQGLLAGHLPNYRGKHFRLDHANLFDRPESKPPVVLAAGGPKAAALAGRKADGLIATGPQADLVQAFVAGGGAGPRYAEVALCCAEREDDAIKTAHHYFRWSLSGWPVLAELPDTRAFAAASSHISPEAVKQAVSCGPSADRHLGAIGRYIDAGYDHIILLQIGPDQGYFFDLFERELAPGLRVKAAA